MFNDWLDKIHNCGFSVDVIFTKDGDKMIALHWKNGHRQMKLFRDADADRCMAAALEFAEKYEAYVLTAAGCGRNH